MNQLKLNLVMIVKLLIYNVVLIIILLKVILVKFMFGVILLMENVVIKKIELIILFLLKYQS